MIVFGWRGFPQYAARCVGAFVKVSQEPVVVVGPKPMVPVEGMERVCGCPVYWTDRVHDFSSQVTAFKPEDVSTLIVSGWGIPALDDLREKVKKAGGRVICMVDNYMMGGGLFGLRLFDSGLFDCLIELLRAVRFRLTLRKRFDGFFVPGKAGRRLLRFYGVSNEKIVEGAYAADETLFTNGKPLPEREKKIIYVGQLNERKNVKRLVEAFMEIENGERDKRKVVVGSGSGAAEFGNAQANLGEVTVIVQHARKKQTPPPKFRPLTEVVEAVAKHHAAGFSPSTTADNVPNLSIAVNGERGEREWELHLYGSGPLKDELNQTIKRSNNQTIHVHDFVQPEQLADLYRSARLFCLPSIEEHWGLVVHEAALSGCGLLLSNRVGAADDLLVEGKNGWTFDPLSVDDMARVMKMAMESDDATLAAMQRESLRLAKNASLERFVEGVREVVVVGGERSGSGKW